MVALIRPATRCFGFLAVAGFIAVAYHVNLMGKARNKQSQLTNEIGRNNHVIRDKRESTNNSKGSSTNPQPKVPTHDVTKIQHKTAKVLTADIEPHAHEYNKVGEPELLLFNQTKCHASLGDWITLLYVYSTPKNVLQRDFIRRTYGSETLFAKYNLRTVFVLGKQVNGDIITDQILKEHVKHQDLVIGDFFESYRNLACKGLTALNFLHHWCTNAKFIIKTDDDSIIATDKILQMLYSDFINGHHFLLGQKLAGEKPIRCNPWHRWCVTPEVYNRTHYPPYLLGVGFAFSYDLVADMYNESFNVPLLPGDDVYFTGILVENLNKTFINLGKKLVSFHKFQTMPLIRGGEKTIVGHTEGLHHMKEAWELFNKNVYVPRIGVDFEVKTRMLRDKKKAIL